jgi:hypothetical protein
MSTSPLGVVLPPQGGDVGGRESRVKQPEQD